MNSIIWAIFFFTMFMCMATYAIYPIIISLLGNFFALHIHRADICPFVTVIISAYNEEKDIEQKILNTLNLDYPEDKIEILIGSDGSSDRTAEIAQKYVNRRLLFVNYLV